MFRNAQIAVVVPAFNEAKHIAAMLRAVPRCVDHIVVVDDGSVDDTARCAAAVDDPRLIVLQHARNSGVGRALCTGYARALAEGAEIVAVMAGDGQMHPDDLPALLTPVVANAADYAKGNRLAHPEVKARMPRARLLGNRVLSQLTRLATGLSIHDSQCGYTALHRRAAERLPWHELWHGYGYPNDLLGLLQRTNARVCDVVVRPVYADEQSGVGLRHALFVIPYVLVRVVLRRLRTRSGQASRGTLASAGTLAARSEIRVHDAVRVVTLRGHARRPRAGERGTESDESNLPYS
jgi:glycosyltransferase involved in cell wall biosynthesis